MNEKQLTTITELFKEHFLENDHLWLFGSRVDDTKKGGDIDLYVQTHYLLIYDVALKTGVKLV